MSNDQWTIRIIVSGLLLVTLIIVAGAIWLTSVDRGVPDSLIALGGTALGGATAFLVSTRSSSDDNDPSL